METFSHAKLTQIKTPQAYSQCQEPEKTSCTGHNVANCHLFPSTRSQKENCTQIIQMSVLWDSKCQFLFWHEGAPRNMTSRRNRRKRVTMRSGVIALFEGWRATGLPSLWLNIKQLHANSQSRYTSVWIHKLVYKHQKNEKRRKTLANENCHYAVFPLASVRQTFLSRTRVVCAKKASSCRTAPILNLYLDGWKK